MCLFSYFPTVENRCFALHSFVSDCVVCSALSTGGTPVKKLFEGGGGTLNITYIFEEFCVGNFCKTQLSIQLYIYIYSNVLRFVLKPILNFSTTSLRNKINDFFAFFVKKKITRKTITTTSTIMAIGYYFFFDPPSFDEGHLVRDVTHSVFRRLY